MEDGGFAGVVLLKKGVFTQLHRLVFYLIGYHLTRWIMTVLTPSSAYEPSGTWDSIHVFEAAERGRQAHYKLTSTIMLHMVDRLSTSSHAQERGPSVKEKDEKSDVKRDGEVSLSGSMTRQVCTSNCPPPRCLLGAENSHVLSLVG